MLSFQSIPVPAVGSLCCWPTDRASGRDRFNRKQLVSLRANPHPGGKCRKKGFVAPPRADRLHLAIADGLMVMPKSGVNIRLTFPNSIGHHHMTSLRPRMRFCALTAARFRSVFRAFRNACRGHPVLWSYAHGFEVSCITVATTAAGLLLIDPENRCAAISN